MARLNVYLPDGLARRAREAGLNVSVVAQEALESQLAARDTNAWLDNPSEESRLRATQRDFQAIWGEVDDEADRRADRVVRRLAGPPRDRGDA